jgi:hypothetical protein
VCGIERIVCSSAQRTVEKPLRAESNVVRTNPANGASRWPWREDEENLKVVCR